MVKKLPVLRCPCCGKLSLLPNFVGFHKLDAFVLRIRGLGRGKGFKNTYEPAPVRGNLEEYWIKRLKEVIIYLENKLNKPQPKKVKILNSVISKILPANYNNVSVMSASPLSKGENRSLTSASMKTRILNVPNSSVISSEALPIQSGSISKK